MLPEVLIHTDEAQGKIEEETKNDFQGTPGKNARMQNMTIDADSAGMGQGMATFGIKGMLWSFVLPCYLNAAVTCR